MHRFTDEQIERCGRIYRANPALHQSGFDFITVLMHEDKLLEYLVFNGEAQAARDEFLPLLPAQQVAAQRIYDGYRIQAAVASVEEDLQQQYPETACHGNAVIAPMRKRWPSAKYKTGSHKQRQRRAVIS